MYQGGVPHFLKGCMALIIENNKGSVSKVIPTTKLKQADTSNFFAVPLRGIISRKSGLDDMCHYDQIPKSIGLMSSCWPEPKQQL